MPYLIGADEAGYGPNLGPLVISGSVWQVPDGVQGDDLYQLLQPEVSPFAPRKQRNFRGAKGDTTSTAPVVIGDSKSLYQSGKGLALLEHGIWVAMKLLDRQPACCGDVWRLLAGADDGLRCEALCGDCDAWPAPRDLDPAEVDRCLPGFCAALGRAGARLVDLRSTAVFPREFNDVTEQYGSKGAALSRWTLALVARLIEPLRDDRICIVCDKHGGRDRYLPLLVEAFPDSFVEIVAEGAKRSVYRFGPSERRVEICFQVKGESHLPTALASMASKYLRELAMEAFNHHWRQQLPTLRATAGYPADAARFKADIAAVQDALGVPDRIVWRNR